MWSNNACKALVLSVGITLSGCSDRLDSTQSVSELRPARRVAVAGERDTPRPANVPQQQADAPEAPVDATSIPSSASGAMVAGNDSTCSTIESLASTARDLISGGFGLIRVDVLSAPATEQRRSYHAGLFGRGEIVTSAVYRVRITQAANVSGSRESNEARVRFQQARHAVDDQGTLALDGQVDALDGRARRARPETGTEQLLIVARDPIDLQQFQVFSVVNVSGGLVSESFLANRPGTPTSAIFTQVQQAIQERGARP